MSAPPSLIAHTWPGSKGSSEERVGLLLAAAYPDRIAKRRQAKGNVYQLANGRSAALDETDSLCREEWIVAAECGGRAGHNEDRIYTAAFLDPALFEEELSGLVQEAPRLEWDEKSGRFVAESRWQIGALLLRSEPSEDIDPATRVQLLTGVVGEKGLGLLKWSPELEQWRARVNLLASELGEPWPNLEDEALLADLSWLEPYLEQVRSLKDFQKLELSNSLKALLPWPLPKELDELAPERFQVPSGSSIRIDYSQSPPVLAVKLQEMFGCTDTPTVARGKVALSVHLLSPAQRPLQVTQDLASFWRNGYKEVKKEMKGRYPKHPWPDDPLTASATGKTNRRLREEG